MYPIYLLFLLFGFLSGLLVGDHVDKVLRLIPFAGPTLARLYLRTRKELT